MSFQSWPVFRSLFIFSCWIVVLSVAVHLHAQSARTFELEDGDRVVFIGNTFVERAIDYGHIETALTTQWPNKNITFRNLGWSGDDARGRSRRFFGPVEDGFKHLETHVDGLAPTVIFVSYGAMESYEGREGLADFEANMNTLLDMLKSTNARIVLLSTIPQENMGPPLPDPAENNANLKLYAASIESLAAKRDCWFIDLFSYMEAALKQSNSPLTDNGVHLNQEGYQAAAQGILNGLRSPSPRKIVQIDGQGNVNSAIDTRVQRVQVLGNGLLVTLQDKGLSSDKKLRLSIPRLFNGSYNLRVNGRNLGTYSSQDWAAGIELPWTPEVDQTALLMQTIVKKNELYFHKWRPQNETYLRGFRKHEQGQNVTELEEFDRYIELEESKIADLKRPRTYTLQLQRVMER
ncbi:MAG: SGNH/GDSL hydrolase family protein [Opitutales bacterium]|nr:SGNH/GDSL hydrolase family protein [Opitutales bacterium]